MRTGNCWRAGSAPLLALVPGLCWRLCATVPTRSAELVLESAVAISGQWPRGAGWLCDREGKHSENTVRFTVNRWVFIIFIMCNGYPPRSLCCLVQCLCSFVSTVLVSVRPGVGVNILTMVSLSDLAS